MITMQFRICTLLSLADDLGEFLARARRHKTEPARMTQAWGRPRRVANAHMIESRAPTRFQLTLEGDAMKSRRN